MNVLFLSESIYPHGSGAELAAYLYAELLSKSGLNVVVLTNKFDGESDYFERGTLKIYRLKMFKDEGSLKYSTLERIDILFSSVFRKMLEWADVVYISHFWFSAIPMAKARRKPVIIHLHDYIPICPLSTTFDLLNENLCKCSSPSCSQCLYAYEKIGGRSAKDVLASVAINSTLGRGLPNLIKLSDAIVCVSEAQRDILSRKDPSISKKLSVIYNPVPNFSDMTLKGDDFGYFGGLNYIKGFKTLYAAATQIKGLTNSLKIHSTKVSGVRKKFADELGLLGFSLYGKVEKRKYDEIYENVRTVLVPSLWPEPWPYVVVEALLQGRLIVASRIGGIPEQTEGCKGVSLCVPDNSVDLAENILFMMELKKENVVDLGLQNRDTFCKKFDNSHSIIKFVNLIESTIYAS